MMKALAALLGSPFSLSFRHFSLAELSSREVGAYLEEKKVVSLAIQRDDPPSGGAGPQWLA